MIRLTLHKNIPIWRIATMVLLFALMGANVLAQEPDSIPQRSEDNVPAFQPVGDIPVYQLNDTLAAIADSTKKGKVLEEGHSATKAVVYALVLPGLGQIYNKKYFKLPFVYGALGGVGYWISYNLDTYRDVVVDYEADPTSTQNEQNLKIWRRQVELSIIALAATYALQVIDAYVDANLYYWDVSPDLSMRVDPYISPITIPGATPTASYGLRLGFKF